MKTYKLGNVKMVMDNTGYIKGFPLKRELDYREAKYVLDTLLGFDILTSEDFEDIYEYKDYKEGLTKDVNNWLKGDADDFVIKEYAYDMSSDEISWGFQLIAVIDYLKKKKIID